MSQIRYLTLSKFYLISTSQKIEKHNLISLGVDADDVLLLIAADTYYTDEKDHKNDDWQVSKMLSQRMRYDEKGYA